MENQENNFKIQGNDGMSNNNPLQENIDKKISKKLIISMLLIITVLFVGVIFMLNKDDKKDPELNEVQNKPQMTNYRISGNSLEAFDLYFLQLENSKENKVYSPLSIKYALAMLEEGTSGDAKTQISNIIGDYQAKKYTNSKNMSFANAMFIKDTYKNSIKSNYTNSLMNKFGASIITDSFNTPNIVNSWISEKTLNLLNDIFNDISDQEFLLLNALAIDMEWEEKFILQPGYGIHTSYLHEDFSWNGDSDIVSKDFYNVNEKVSGMDIIASFNNYDIVKALGENNIRNKVKSEFEKYLKENPDDSISYYVDNENISGLTNDELMEKYLDNYIKEISSNFKAEDKTTDFKFYVDEKVKVFAKDLKEYDGTTLQYVGVMPIQEDLDKYINNLNIKELSNIISNLKELKAENFKDGVVTKINGFIPKFKFDYKLELMNDLKKLGVTNIFEEGKANLTNISDDDKLYINNAEHKANIEFTQEGIKAAAVTELLGAGAGGMFDYLFEVPVEEIDLTFDKPYMFIIRDKESGEVWFAGTVYNPLLYSEDTTKGM